MKYPGLYIEKKYERNYPHKNLANALGYLREINREQLDKRKDKGYKAGDYIGQSGLEKYYEEILRGQPGVKYVLVDKHRIERGSFMEGSLDSISVAGQNLKSGIDLDVQAYAEELIGKTRGAIVAIEPKTGEIICMVTSPNYDPNQLTGKEFTKNYKALISDPEKPLFNKAIQMYKPPGSTFKAIDGLIALNTGRIDLKTFLPCTRALVNCHGAHSGGDFEYAVKVSCNGYFAMLFKRLINQGWHPDNSFKDTRVGLEWWKKELYKYGVGKRLGIDIPNEAKGSLPTVASYDKYLGRWNFYTIYSLGIGQGELGLTPLQMANAACIIANRGYYYRPHFISEIGDTKKPLPQYQEKVTVGGKKEHYEALIRGMKGAAYGGTVPHYYNTTKCVMAGKTGTVQSTKYKEDHSAFIGFAPADDPKIAIAVYFRTFWLGRNGSCTNGKFYCRKIPVWRNRSQT